MDKKIYMKPMSEIVRIGSRRLVLDGVHETKQSNYMIGDDEGGTIGITEDDPDAKEFGMDDWMIGWDDGGF